jgi:peptidoglycan/LPS O-acetylase OafA/YrhL
MSVSLDQGPPRLHLGRIPALDGARAIAVLLVMGYHAGIAGFEGGRAGVDVFFVLSGFLITALLLEERTRHGAIRLGAFYMRRVLRLYPALVVATLLALALSALKVPIFGGSSSSFRSTLEAAPFALLYTANIPRAAGWSGGGYLGHTWSLSIEEQFYLLWPLVVIVVMRRRLTPVVLGWIALGCAIASAVLRAGLDLAGYSSEMLYNATFSHVDGIFAGCALAVLWAIRPDAIAWLARPALTLLAVTAATIVIIDGRNMNVYGFVVVVTATLVVLCDLLARRSSMLSVSLSHPALVAVGRRSYGLYLYHWPIFLFIGIDTRPHILALGFGASFAAAWMSYAWIEVPFLRMKDRWATQRSTSS